MRHDPVQHDIGNKNRVTFNSQVCSDSVANTYSPCKIDESVVQDLKQRVFAREKATSDLLKQRYDKVPGQEPHMSVHAEHDDGLENINPKEEIEKQIYAKHH